MNNSKVRAPKWTAEDKLAYPIVVSRGEPTRTDSEMFDAVHEQVVNYHAAVGRAIDDELAYLVTASIALDHIYRVGAQGVVISKESLAAYLSLARSKQ